MPALVETEVVRRGLEKEVLRRRIKNVEVRPGGNAMKVIKRHGRRKEFEELLVGARIDAIFRRGTTLELDLDSGSALMIDLGRAGRLLKAASSERLAPHTHVVMQFTVGGQLRLSDPGLTTEVYVLTDADARPDDGRAIDPLNGPLEWRRLSGMLEEAHRGMKELLMDDRFICGLEELYSDEVLFAAGLRYDRGSDRLSAQEVRRLYRALQETLHDALQAGGTSWGDHDFADLKGEPGRYQLELKVFERAGEPCLRCRSSIEKARLGRTTTFFCPQCQS